MSAQTPRQHRVLADYTRIQHDLECDTLAPIVAANDDHPVPVNWHAIVLAILFSLFYGFGLVLGAALVLSYWGVDSWPVRLVRAAFAAAGRLP